ncbi:TolC family protein [Spirosoma sp. SC4-14]|uniref:TolC family protein n=1 Tax=Spirosoma sp. SC4-14 TaxID=3128900 RepID=UPI0030D4AA94
MSQNRVSRLFLPAAILLLATGNRLNAQSAQTLTMAQALDATARNYPALKARLAETAAARSETNAMKAGYLPSVIWQNQALYATSNQVRGTFFPNEGTAIPTSGGIKPNGYTSNAVWTSFSTLFVNWKAINFGKYKADLSAAHAGEATAQAAYDRALFEQRVQTADAYLLTIIFDQATRIQQANLNRVRDFQTVMLAGSRAGLRPGVDSSLAAAEVSKAELLLLESQRIAQAQRLRLSELTGVPVASIKLDTTAFRRAAPQVFEIPDSSIAANPILRYYRRRIDFGQARQRAIRQSYWPSISVIGGLWARGSGISDKTADNGDFIYNSSLGAGLPFRAYNYLAGVSMNWRVSDIFRIRREEQTQQFRNESARHDYDEQALRIKTQQETAELQLGNAYEALKKVPVQLAAAQAAFSQANSRYGAGLSSILELTQATAVLNRAEIDQSVAVNNVWRYLLLKAAAAGSIDDFLKLTSQP